MDLSGEESGLGRRGGKHLKYSKKGKLNILHLFQLHWENLFPVRSPLSLIHMSLCVWSWHRDATWRGSWRWCGGKSGSDKEEWYYGIFPIYPIFGNQSMIIHSFQPETDLEHSEREMQKKDLLFSSQPLYPCECLTCRLNHTP